jgi:ammonium transporter Rh
MLGRLTPTQIILMLPLELIFYAINEYICVAKLEAVDMGGSMYVHSFGAYFGIAFSLMWGKPKNTDNEGSSYYSDVFAMVGTIFLWMFWPSFNSALAPESSFQKERVIVNTVIALTASCITTFILSPFFENGKFEMVHIQNATLAGGVAIGSACDLAFEPWLSLLVGALGGAVSVLGYVYLTPWLNEQGIYDVCGVHNLHGMPGIIGGTAGALVSGFLDDEAFGANIAEIYPARANRTASEQLGFQFAALFVTLTFALVGGALTALAVKAIEPDTKENEFMDKDEWKFGFGEQK